MENNVEYIWDKYNNRIKVLNERILHELINEDVIYDTLNPKVGEWLDICVSYPLEYETIFCNAPHEIIYDCPMITRELLEANGFKLKKFPGGDGWDDFDEYELWVENKNDRENNKPIDSWKINFKHNLSNTKNRDWGLHIDNKVCESVAYVDVSTVEHANKLFEIMDIKFRLEV